MNIVILKGRLVRDSEIKAFSNGGCVLNNALALNSVWYDATGTKHEETDFIEIKANNKTAEMIGKWFKKGDGITINGHLKQEVWQDKTTGQNRYKVVVVVDKAHFELTQNGAQNVAQSSTMSQNAQNVAPNTAPNTQNRTPMYDENGDEIPF